MDISVGQHGQLPAFPVGFQPGGDFTAYEAILSMLLLLQMHLGHKSLAPHDGSTGTIARWWFYTFFMFIPTWGNDPIWLIFFKWVGSTTN